MVSLALSRFFGFAPVTEGREGHATRRADTNRQGEPFYARNPDKEEIARQTTITGRPAADVLAALRGTDLADAHRAMTEIYLAYFETLWHFAYRWTQSQSRAEEVVHDVFLALWTRRMTFVLRGDLIFYLRSAVRKEIYDELRHTAVVTRMESAVEDHTLDTPAIGHIVDPEVALEEADAERLVKSALATISPRDRDVFTMRWIDRMTLDEIAGELGVSRTRVRIILARAMARLVPLLERLREN